MVFVVFVISIRLIVFDQLKWLMIRLISKGLIICFRQLFCIIQLMVSGVSEGVGEVSGVVVSMVVGSMLVIVEKMNFSVIVRSFGVVVWKNVVLVIFIRIVVVVSKVLGCMLWERMKFVVILFRVFVVMMVVLMSFVVFRVMFRCCMRNMGRNVIRVKNCRLQVVKLSVSRVIVGILSNVLRLVGFMFVVLYLLLVGMLSGSSSVVISISSVFSCQLVCQFVSSGLNSIERVILFVMKVFYRLNIMLCCVLLVILCNMVGVVIIMMRKLSFLMK